MYSKFTKKIIQKSVSKASGDNMIINRQHRFAKKKSY